MTNYASPVVHTQILLVRGGTFDVEQAGKQRPQVSEDPVRLSLMSMVTIVTITRSEEIGRSMEAGRFIEEYDHV